MKGKTSALALFLFCVTSVNADYSVSDKGEWPETWPKEMETLRKQSRTLIGSLANVTLHEIPFAKREQFEAVWPHILKIKTKGAPIVLRLAPDNWMIKIEAGVRIRCPPPGNQPEGPIGNPGDADRWLYTKYIELIVDGKVVDLNRIPLPADTPIIDKRFGNEKSR